MTDDNDDSKSPLPPWQAPNPPTVSFDPSVYVMNSLTRQKEHFLTMDGSHRLVWYMCGPTVYAESHMGHARTYLGFDILRRILSDYFGYQITLIMNITDIDDKIIARSAEKDMHHLALTRQMEEEFFQDMDALGVAPPTALTRVTEYMDEIVEYIQRIVDQGLAYESNGSVYFHVEAFQQTPNMHYCKLAPEQMDDDALRAEGEGKLTQQEFASDKKGPRDFALWKRTKEGEPAWDSPWGPGRPGWHIECSVMASDVLQRLAGVSKMDIHSGGVDLKFPHHDNEMAQAEAECGETQWVNYFVHAGHLNIKGLKMSKSLKNFITIQQALEINSGRQIRMLFLLHKYNSLMDYGDNTMSRALEAEKRFVEFFHNVKACLRKYDMKSVQKWDAATVDLQKSLHAAMDAVRDRLKDDFDTPGAMGVLADLVKTTNLYMEGEYVVGLVVRNVAAYITKMFGVFGFAMGELGFADGTSGSSREQMLAPVLDALMEFRYEVRDKARANDAGAILGLCDGFRDATLPPLGIRLEDKPDHSVWKLADPQELVLEMQQKEAEAARRAEEKAARLAEEAKKEEMNKLPPIEYLQQLTLEDGTTLAYSKYGDDGLPTHDATGEPLNKSQVKKVQKLIKTQQSKYDKWLKSQS